jgi:ATP-dependent Lhr-like helicase
VEHLGGAQFAVPGGLERLRDLREPDPTVAETLVLAAADPANAYGAALPWPDRARGRASRAAGAFVVLVDGRAALFLERGSRSLLPLVDPDDSAVEPALTALVAAAHDGMLGRVGLERVDGENALSGPWADRLAAVGFRRGPRRLHLDREVAGRRIAAGA